MSDKNHQSTLLDVILLKHKSPNTNDDREKWKRKKKKERNHKSILSLQPASVLVD